jgi:3-oxoacyl-[acyl-carrier protein] reductase
MTPLEQYDTQGWLGPLACVDGDLVEACLRALRGADRTINRHLDLPEVAALLRSADLVAPYRELLGDDLLLWRTAVFHGTPRLTWHRDLYSEFLTADGDNVPQVSGHLALTAAAADNCLVFLPGSHRWSDEEVQRRFGFARADAHIPGNCRFEGGWVEAARRMVLKPGELLVFHPMLLHASSATLDEARGTPPGGRVALGIRVTVPSVVVQARAFEGVGSPRKGCVLLSGKAPAGRNTLIEMAGTAAGHEVNTGPVMAPQGGAMENIKGRVALVTGSGRGIGREIALALAGAGAKVCFTARTVSQIEAAAKRARDAGAEAVAVPADVTDPAAVQRLVDETIKRFGGLDILFVNAGGMTDPQQKNVEETGIKDWKDTLDLNLFGAYLTVRTAIPHLRNGQAAKIVVLGSGVRHREPAKQSAYACAKAGLYVLMRILARELLQDGIAVNELIPGSVGKDSWPEQDFETRRRALWQSKREWLKQPKDVVDLALWLANQSDKGPTGQSFSLLRGGGL